MSISTDIRKISSGLSLMAMIGFGVWAGTSYGNEIALNQGWLDVDSDIVVILNRAKDSIRLMRASEAETLDGICHNKTALSLICSGFGFSAEGNGLRYKSNFVLEGGVLEETWSIALATKTRTGGNNYILEDSKATTDSSLPDFNKPSKQTINRLSDYFGVVLTDEPTISKANQPDQIIEQHSIEYAGVYELTDDLPGLVGIRVAGQDVWISDDDILVKERGLPKGIYALKSDSGRARKIVIQGKPSLTTNPDDSSTPGNVDNIGQTLQWNYFIFEETDSHYLVGVNDAITVENASKVIKGWVPKNQVVEWDNRIGLEFNSDFTAGGTVDRVVIYELGHGSKSGPRTKGKLLADKKSLLAKMTAESPRHLFLGSRSENKEIQLQVYCMLPECGSIPPQVSARLGWVPADQSSDNAHVEFSVLINKIGLRKLITRMSDLAESLYFSEGWSHDHLDSLQHVLVELLTGDQREEGEEMLDYLQRVRGIPVISRILKSSSKELVKWVQTSDANRIELTQYLRKKQIVLEALLAEGVATSGKWLDHVGHFEHQINTENEITFWFDQMRMPGKPGKSASQIDALTQQQVHAWLSAKLLP
ncbi:MAG: hypothetical protein ACI909_002528 [Planctomycetota bacterium]|jgi:hypothetical protein